MTGPDDPQPTAGFWGRILIAILGATGHTIYRLRWRDLDNMPQRGPVIVAVNHLSHIDTILIARLVWDSGRIPRFMAKSSLWDIPVVGAAMRVTEQIPVTRDSAIAADSLKHAQQALQRNEVVIVYPEGTTTKDPEKWPMHFKTGLARLVLLEPHAKVVPISQWGAQTAKAGESRFRRVISARIAPALDMTKWRDQPATPENLEQIGAEVMAVIRSGVGELRGETPTTTPFRLPRKPLRPTEPDQSSTKEPGPPA